MSISPNEKVEISNDFMAISCLSSILLAVFFSTKMFRYFSFQRNDVVDKIIYYVDPFLIQILLFLIIAFKGIRLVQSKSLNFLKFTGLVLFFGFVAFPISNFINSSILKPIFRYSRPVSIAEQFVMGALLNLKKNEIVGYPEIATKEIGSYLKSFEAKETFELIKKEDFEYNQAELLKKVENLNLAPDDKNKLKLFIVVCHENWNKFSIENIKNSYLQCSIKILKNNRQMMEEPWFTLMIKSELAKLLNYYNKPAFSYWHDSSPSDFSFRSTILLLMALTLLTQKKSIKKTYFKTKIGEIFFWIINIIFFFFVVYSRVYSLRHDLSDIGMGILFGTFFFYLFSIVFFREKVRAKILFLSMFFFLIIIITVLYAQDITKSFIPFFIIFSLLSLLNMLYPHRSEAA